jgi:hypothetical protein
MSMNATFGFCGGAILLRAFPRALLGTWISSTALVTTHVVDYQNGQLASSFGFTGYHRILGETSPAIGGIMIESSGSVPKCSLPPVAVPLTWVPRYDARLAHKAISFERPRVLRYGTPSVPFSSLGRKQNSVIVAATTTKPPPRYFIIIRIYELFCHNSLFISQLFDFPILDPLIDSSLLMHA